MKIKEILDIETKRLNEKNFSDIHLFQEGLFYRAYECSAWLCVRYLNNNLKVIHRDVKSEEKSSFVFIGFPTDSLEDYAKDSKLDKVDDKHCIITLPDGKVKPLEKNKTLEEDFENWKRSIPKSESKINSTSSSKSGLDCGAGLTAIMQKILAYPLEQKSPFESMIFLSELKKKLTDLL